MTCGCPIAKLLVWKLLVWSIIDYAFPIRRIGLRALCTCFYLAYTYQFKQATFIYSLTHYAKGKPLPGTNMFSASTDCKYRDSVSFSLPAWGSFSPFPHGTLRYWSERFI